jgi:hypothetical protein
VGIVYGVNPAADATEGPMEEGVGLTWVILDAGPTTMTMACLHERMMEPEHHRNRAAMAMAPRNVLSPPPPPRPVIGQHHSREEGCGLDTLSSCGDVDDNNKDNSAK